MKPFNAHLQDVLQKINIKDEDRKSYTEMFDTVKNWLLKEMCDVDPVFKKLYKGTSLFGSYSNQVRIVKPSEFDIFILLQFPFPMTNVSLLGADPGFVHINLKNALTIPIALTSYSDVCKTFTKLVDLKKGQSLLNRVSLQTWIHDIIEEVLKTRSMPDGYYIGYTKCSVAQNIYVYEQSYPHKTIAIDFVPAIIFGTGDKWMNPPRKSKTFQLNDFHAIPKSSPGKRKNGTCTFQLVNPKAEHELLWDKQNLKVVYRLLKSLRDCYGLNRFKSYFLTTIFLWEVKKQKAEFWQNSVDCLLIHMLGVLHKYLAGRALPYFWFESFNLLSTLKHDEITKYADIIKTVWDTIKTYPDQDDLSYGRLASHFEIPSD